MGMRGIAIGIAMASAIATAHPCLAAATCGLKGGLPIRTQAISLAIAGQGDAATAMARGDAFLEGYVAYLSGRYELAVERLTAYAISAKASKKGRERDEALARAGYWAAEALTRAGKPEEASAIRRETANQRGTFYALLVDVRTALPGHTSYPTPSLLYTDPRADLALVYAVTREESNFNPAAKSGAGAQGAMQMLVSTAQRVASGYNVNVDKQKLSHDLDYNAALGSTYLGWLIQRYRGYAPLAAAAYNAGEGCADAWITRLGDPRSAVDPLVWVEAIPILETRQYVQRVMGSYFVYLSQGTVGTR